MKQQAAALEKMKGVRYESQNNSWMAYGCPARSKRWVKYFYVSQFGFHEARRLAVEAKKQYEQQKQQQQHQQMQQLLSSYETQQHEQQGGPLVVRGGDAALGKGPEQNLSRCLAIKAVVSEEAAVTTTAAAAAAAAVAAAAAATATAAAESV